jgi:uncharacterized membrane protein YuzA (DUF378 family)
MEFLNGKKTIISAILYALVGILSGVGIIDPGQQAVGESVATSFMVMGGAHKLAKL